jgi:hypothetical protein
MGKSKKKRTKKEPLILEAPKVVSVQHSHSRFGEFNNLATPIAAVFSIIIFGYIAYQQNELMETQNQLILSQSLKPYYKKQIEDLFDRENPERRLIVGDQEVDLFEYANNIPHFLERIVLSDDYKRDKGNFKMGLGLSQDSLKTRTYHGELLLLKEYFEKSLSGANRNGQSILSNTERLITEIVRSKLFLDDKKLLLAEINSNMDVLYSKVAFSSVTMFGPIDFSIYNRELGCRGCLLPLDQGSKEKSRLTNYDSLYVVRRLRIMSGIVNRFLQASDDETSIRDFSNHPHISRPK